MAGKTHVGWKCHQCGKAMDGYNRIEYVERELVQTADGGDYTRLLLPFCSMSCLHVWTDLSLHDEPSDD